MNETQVNFIDTESHTNTLLVSCQDNLLRIYSINDTSNPTQVLEGHSSPVISSAYINKNNIIASFSLDGTLLVWQLVNDKYSVKLKMENDKNGVAMCATKNLDKIYIALADGTVFLYDFKSQENESNEKDLAKIVDKKITEKNGEKINETNFEYEKKEVVKMENTITAMSCNNNYFVVCDENGYWDGKYNNRDGIRDISVINTNHFNINCFCFITDNEIVVDNQEIPITGARSIKWSENGLSFVVGLENGSLKGFSIDTDGKFVEVEMEKIDQ